MSFLAFIALFPRSQPTSHHPSLRCPQGFELAGECLPGCGLKLPDYLTLLRLAVASQQLLHLWTSSVLHPIFKVQLSASVCSQGHFQYQDPCYHWRPGVEWGCFHVLVWRDFQKKPKQAGYIWGTVLAGSACQLDTS